MNSVIKRYFFSCLLGTALVMAGMPSVAQNPLSVYTGKYKQDVNGYQAFVDVYISNNKLVGKQSWDGKIRTFEYLGDNKFIISMDGWAVKFIRNKANKVIQMQVLGNEIWVKV